MSAADWIKVRSNLDTDPRVIEMACELGISEVHAVGCLWKVWSWIDQHSADGVNCRVNRRMIDRFTQQDGFADALEMVGWLKGENGKITFPNYEEHNGATAKRRAQKTKWQAQDRAEDKPVHNSGTERPIEDSRVEESREEHTPPLTKEQLLSNCANWGVPAEVAEVYWTDRSAENWVTPRSQQPITSVNQLTADLKRFHARWEANRKKFGKDGAPATDAPKGWTSAYKKITAKTAPGSWDKVPENIKDQIRDLLA